MKPSDRKKKEAHEEHIRFKLGEALLAGFVAGMIVMLAILSIWTPLDKESYETGSRETRAKFEDLITQKDEECRAKLEKLHRAEYERGWRSSNALWHCAKDYDFYISPSYNSKAIEDTFESGQMWLYGHMLEYAREQGWIKSQEPKESGIVSRDEEEPEIY